jgi:hypothetical protein
MKNQYARVQSTSEGEEEILNETVHDQNYNFDDKFLDDNQEEEIDLWHSEHNV